MPPALVDYIELRARSAFSFLEGASNPEDLVERAGALDYPALALADRGGVYGAPRFHQAARRAGVRAILGAEIDLETGVGGVCPGCSPSATGGATRASAGWTGTNSRNTPRG